MTDIFRSLGKFILLHCVAGFSLIAAVKVRACTCNPLATPFQAMQEAEVVFVGTVLSSRDEEDSFRYFRFRVDENVKGKIPRELEIYGGWFTSSCYSGFETGEKYLIYAYSGRGEKLSSQYCQRRLMYKYAVAEVDFLREFLNGAKEPKIYGSVGREDIDPISGAELVTTLEGLRIVAEADGKRYETRTSKNGSYRFDSLPDGEYSLAVDAPKDLDARRTERIVALGEGDTWRHENRSSAYESFTLKWANSIIGNVVDSEGNVIERATVKLFPYASKNREIPESRYRITDYLGPDSKFSIWGLTPGSYVLVAQLRAPIPGKELHKTYYSNTLEPERAAAIKVAAGEELKLNVQFKDLTAVRLEGVVQWPDGTPMKGGAVRLMKLEKEEDPENYSYDLDSPKDGRFSIQAFVGGEYWLYASPNFDGLRAKFPDRRDFDSRDMDHGTRVLIKVQKGMRPLVLTIPFPKSKPSIENR